ncbi:O-antigen ligase family protein [Oscillatoria sp. FACHB-1406]|uniref:O-antigen ligase family protein n=1 Tax=Oscillatoria sp. FACHB-1406 TaxID=2692846 RepID=UPI001687158D|nr:O-antigen ligase family protein [Oscillatoria sp. FACHB-1406]MBD2577607.1 O-antigen ligase family protein [Oscillatoria sp. FACHB-1406]
MKQILKDPIILCLLISLGSLYGLILFNYIGRYKSYALQVEKFFIYVFLITIAGATGATIMPFPKLHPRALSNVAITPTTVMIQLAFYGMIVMILSPRLRYTLRDMVSVANVLLVRDPFLITTLILIGLSRFWSDTPDVTFKTSLVYLATSLVAIYVGKQYSWSELFEIGKVVSLILLLVSFGYSFTSSGKDFEGAWVGIIGHKNQFCFVTLFGAIIWFVNALYYPRSRNFSIFVFVLSLIAINQGKSGAAKVLVVCLLALWFYLGTAKKLPSQWAFVSVVLFMIVSVCLTIIVTENLKFIVVDTLNKDLTITGRTDFWPLIIDKLNERPFLGYGIDGFWQPWRDADNPARSIVVIKTQFVPPHSHNGFLDLACDLGYVGLVVFMGSFFTSIAKAVTYLGRAPMPEAGLPLLLLTYILMTNLTETGLLGVTSLWFWYIVIAVRTSLDTANNSVREQPYYIQDDLTVAQRR